MCVCVYVSIYKIVVGMVIVIVINFSTHYLFTIYSSITFYYLKLVKSAMNEFYQHQGKKRIKKVIQFKLQVCVIIVKNIVFHGHEFSKYTVFKDNEWLFIKKSTYLS